MKKLLHDWPALQTAFTDFLSSEHNKKETCAKVTGFKQIEVLPFFIYNDSISRYRWKYYAIICDFETTC